jgi:hypothetical protein
MKTGQQKPNFCKFGYDELKSLREISSTESIMNRRITLPILAAALAFGALSTNAPPCRAFDCWTPTCSDCGYMLPIRRAQCYNWNRNYSYTDYGQPVALLVPPTAQLQTNWGWGVASSRISRIDHQFQRNFPGYGQFGGPFRPTPVWPSDTTEFGVYPVRAPW